MAEGEDLGHPFVRWGLGAFFTSIYPPISHKDHPKLAGKGRAGALIAEICINN